MPFMDFKGLPAATRSPPAAPIVSMFPDLTPINTWARPTLDKCHFYHSFDLPDGTVVHGDWDLRGQFEHYIGNVDLKGKTVFDMGTATGFLAFSAETGGAASVTASEMRSMNQSDRVPHAGNLACINKRRWATEGGGALDRQKNGFWYVWHAFNSRVEVVYCSIEELLSYDRQFDIVLQGALLEHLSDPVTAIGAACRLAREKVVIAFTAVHESNDEFLQPAITWDTPHADYVWWVASAGLYRRVFGNMGFDVEFKNCNIMRDGAMVPRKTIIGTRRA